MADDRLIVALDVSTMDAVKKSYYPSVIRLAFTRSEWSYSTPKEQNNSLLQEQNKQIFLDLKLHDIPNTVAHGVSSLTRLGASLITLHGQGGPVMMKAAVEAARESG